METTTSKSIGQKHQKLMRLATYFSVITSTVIIIIKVAAWIYTGSLSVLASLTDSVLDVISATVNLFAVRYALQPADDDHRFGHGKAEDIAAFAQSAFIAGSALFIVIEAIGRTIHPEPLQHESVGIVVMVSSMALIFALILFQRSVIKKTHSSVIKSDFLHHMGDLFGGVMVVFSLAVSVLFGISGVDTIMSFAIAAYILKGAWGVGKGAFDNLMDKEMPEGDRAKIKECVLSNKNVHGMHELRTRVSGMSKFIQFHVELDGEMSLKSANVIAHDIENKLQQLFPSAEVIVHQDHEQNNKELPFGNGKVVPLINKKTKRKKK